MVHFLILFICFFLLLMDFLFLTASKLKSVYSCVCKYRFMSNQSCHSTPTQQESRWLLFLNWTVIASHVRVVFDGCHLLIIFPGCHLCSFCDCTSYPVRISQILGAPDCLPWDLVSFAVCTGAAFPLSSGETYDTVRLYQSCGLGCHLEHHAASAGPAVTQFQTNTGSR